MATASRTQAPFLADAAAPPRPAAGRKRRGNPALRLLLPFLGLMLAAGGLLTWLQIAAVRNLAVRQLDLRVVELAQSAGAAVSPPMRLGDFLGVNLAAEQLARLPEVAYVAVFNARSALVAGLVGHPERLPPALAARIAAQGFPREILPPPAPGGATAALSRIRDLEGIAIREAATPIPDAQGHVLVGLFAGPLDRAGRRALMLLWSALGGLTLAGAAGCLGLGRRWRRALDELTLAAERLQRGDCATPVPAAALPEAAPLAEALEGLRVALTPTDARRSGA